MDKSDTPKCPKKWTKGTDVVRVYQKLEQKGVSQKFKNLNKKVSPKAETRGQN